MLGGDRLQTASVLSPVTASENKDADLSACNYFHALSTFPYALV